MANRSLVDECAQLVNTRMYEKLSPKKSVSLTDFDNILDEIAREHNVNREELADAFAQRYGDDTMVKTNVGS